jgi:FkbM family methyltransferase
MIEFIEFIENKTGIKFKSEFTIDKNVIISISDGYTGLNLWKDNITISPNITYFFSCKIHSAERKFEILSEDETEVLFSIYIYMDTYPSIKQIDIKNILKSYKYDNKERGASYSIFEIFLNEEYKNKNVKINKDDTVLDIGGNIGIFSLYSLYKKAKEVHVFEPGEKQYKAIVDNLSGTFKNLKINNMAVSKQTGSVNFYENNISTLSSTMFNSNNKIKSVPSITIEDYFKEKKLDKIDFLKIDCEGGEYEIIEHINKDFLQSKVDKIVLEYHHFKDEDKLRSKQLIDKLINCNFTVKIKGNMIYCKNKSPLEI